jgi:hypothetical protein
MRGSWCEALLLAAFLSVSSACRPPDSSVRSPSPDDAGPPGAGVLVDGRVDHEQSPSALAEAIDVAVECARDPWSGARGMRKRRFLVKIGKPAVPALIRAMQGLDLAYEDDRCSMTPLTETLQEITGLPCTAICRVGLCETESENIALAERLRRQWYRWLLSPDGAFYLSCKDAPACITTKPEHYFP